MIIKMRKMLLCALSIQLLFISLSFVSHAATCSNSWRSPSSQTMETEIMSASMTDYANIERYLSIKQGWKTIHIYFLRGVLLVKGLDDSEINYDNIFWYPMTFMQSGVLAKAFPQGPCSITQKTRIALTEAEGEIVPKSQGVIAYNYTLTGKQNVKHFKGVMNFTPKEAAPPDDTVVKGFKIVNRTKPYTVIGSKDMPVTTLGELRRALDAKKTPKEREKQAQKYQEMSDIFAGKDTTKDTMKPADIVMALQKTIDSQDNNELYPLEIGNLWGYVNKDGRVIVEPSFHVAFFFENDVARVHINHKWGLIDKTGRFIVEPQYDEIGGFRSGLASVRKNGKVGFINESGKIIVPIEGDYKFMPEFKNGVACILKNDKRFFIDINGHYITEDQFCKAAQCTYLKTPRPVGKKGRWGGSKWGLVNSSNDFILKPRYDHINDEKDGLFLVKKKVRYGMFLLKKHDRYGFIDKRGNLVIDLQFEDASDFKDGLAGAKKNGKYGFIDKTGRFVINPQFESVREFEDGIAPVMINKKWGLIDKRGYYIVNPQFESASFHYGVGTIEKNGKVGLVDRTGKVIIEPIFDGQPWFTNGLGPSEFAIVRQGLDRGVINKRGEIIIPLQYSIILDYPNPAHPNAPNVFQVTKFPHKGYVDTSGNIFVMTDEVCGQHVVKNGKGEITWPKNIKKLCRQKK